MNNRIIEILIHLLGHLKDHDLDMDNLSEISDVLVTRGYDDIEIEEAINWFFEKIGTHSVKSSEIVEQRDKSFRILHDYERINITPEVYGYLLKLKSMNIITGSQMEKVLDYCMLLGSDSTSELEINEIVANVLFEDY